MTTISKDHELRQILDETAAAQRDALNKTGWWHSIDLGNGQITPGAHKIEELRDNYARFLLPEDLAGKRVLDIGCWDGFYTFEAERHGARVASVDCWRPEKFFVAKQALNSSAEFHELSVYEVTKEKLDVLREADAIVVNEIKAAGLYRHTSQAFAVLLPVLTVGVMGDARTYENVIALRCVDTDDFMTADWSRLPFDLLAQISTRIINEVKGVNRVCYDISSKPPATIEWE